MYGLIHGFPFTFSTGAKNSNHDSLIELQVRIEDDRLIKDGKFTDIAKGKTFILNKQDLDNHDQQNNWFFKTDMISLQEVMTHDITSDTHYSPFEDQIKYTEKFRGRNWSVSKYWSF